MNEEKKYGAVDTQGNIIQGGNVVGKANPLDVPISSATLSGNESPLVIPPPSISTDAEGLSAFSTSYGEQFKKQQAELAQAQQSASANKEESKTSFKDTISNFLGISASRPELEAEAGLDAKAQKVTDVTNQIEALDRAKVNELRALEGVGLTPTQKNQRQSEINRRYAFQQADLALIQSAANRDYETAFNIIDRKIELQLEPLKLQLEFEKLFYEDNKDSFDKADQRLFESRIADTTRQYEDEKTTRTGIANLITTALQNGVQLPARVIKELDGARNIQEATAILSRNGISLENSLDRQIKLAQLAKLNAESAKLAGIEEISPYQKERQTRILESVKDLKNRVNFQTTGIVGAIGKGAPASIPRNFANDLAALRANIAFGELTAMREASKTGGALGQVSNIELGLLESALAGLDQGQSPANFRKNLQRVEDSITRWQGAVDKYGVPSSVSSGVLVSPDGTQQVDASQLTPEQLEEARNAGWQ